MSNVDERNPIGLVLQCSDRLNAVGESVARIHPLGERREFKG